MDGFNYLSANNFLGSGGVNGAYCELIHFYTDNKEYIHSYKVRQYGLVRIPDNAKYCRVTLYSKTVQKNFKVEFSNFRSLTQCQFKNLYIGGRMGLYRYINMDQAIEEALILADKIIEEIKND